MPTPEHNLEHATDANLEPARGGGVEPTQDANVAAVRRGFAAAARGDLPPIYELLAPDVRWHAVGDDTGGCQNRDQALAWMSDAISRGINVELVDVRPLDETRVHVLLRRRSTEPTAPPPHREIVTFRGDQVVEMIVYPTADEALRASRG
jgi:hypothetical protein